jgi:RimJ/RimL family protein N-acetyltransferase
VPTPEIWLRNVAAEDLPLFFEHQRDPESVRMAAFPSRDREKFDAHWAKILADDTLVKKSILAGDTVVGNAVVFPRDGVLEVGYWIGREHWGKGYASRALAALLTEVRERPLHARVAEHNVGSIRVLERNGFRAVGRETGDPAGDGSEIVDVLFMLDADAEGSER